MVHCKIKGLPILEKKFHPPTLYKNKIYKTYPFLFKTLHENPHYQDLSFYLFRILSIIFYNWLKQTSGSTSKTFSIFFSATLGGALPLAL